MHNLPDKVLWAYIILLLVGGLIGFFKAKSKVSLITSAVFAALLALTTLRSVFQAGFARDLANVILILLLIVFTIRLAKTKKFMPSGLMLAVTIAALVLRNLLAN
ncbi:MAG TPA: TMEM14 family protein [Verrucomicrobiae bacterium]|nr:TMEM14 family protein [Verrucomicrobiae bacterium]